MLIEKIFKFGEITSKTLVTILFYTGILPIIYQSIEFGKTVYLNNFVEITVKNGDWYTGKEINNLPLGIFQGVIVFLISIIIWKVICEIIFIMVRYFEINSRQKK